MTTTSASDSGVSLVNFATCQMVVFDLDDTLAPSKSPLPAPMVERLRNLLQVVDVCVISGGAFAQFNQQVLTPLAFSEGGCGVLQERAQGQEREREQIHEQGREQSQEQNQRQELEGERNTSLASCLHLMPTCGTRYYRWQEGKWQQIYALDLPAEQKRQVIGTLEQCARKLDLWEENPWGQIVEDRGSQITFSALGQEAPLAAKRAWDPDGTKKRALSQAVAALLPDLEVRSGGTTSIDVTSPGVDKAFGMEKLAEYAGCTRSDTVFVGDRLDAEGNDYPVKAAGWPTVAVASWEETLEVIEQIVAAKRQKVNL